jgi:DNA polymerase-1
MIVGEAPGKQEDLTGEPFVGKAGELLDDMLINAGLDPDDIFITNAVSCRPPDNKTPTKGQIKACKKWLDYQIAMVSPRYVMLLGNTPLQSITGKAGIKAARGRPFKKDGIIFLPTFHPAFALRDPDQRILIENDIQLFKDIIEVGDIPRENELNHTIIKSRRQFDLLLDSLTGTVSFDIETSCLYPWQRFDDKGRPAPAKIMSIGFGTKAGEFILPVHHPESPWLLEAIDDMINEIDAIIDRCILVAHAGKFDFLWMLVHYGVDWYHHFNFDTMLAHYLLDENSNHGLKELAQKFMGAPNWDVDKDLKQGVGPLNEHGLYLAHDLYYTRQLRWKFGKMLNKDPGVKQVFKHIMMPCARLFVEVEYDGLVVDETKFDQAETFLRGELAKAEQKLKPWQPSDDFNWGSSQQLAKLLFEDMKIPVVETTKTGRASCSESVLTRIDHQLVGDLLAYRAAKQQLSFFIEGWKPYLHRKYVRGRWVSYLHPSFKLHGTVTGRLSSEHPNAQQIPRDKRIRSLIVAEDGWTLIECDLSQIELRIAAELANERNMFHAFINGIDIHWLTAIKEIERGAGLKELVLDTARTARQDKSLTYSQAIEVLLQMGPDAAIEINEEWKEYRKKAKAINFGYLFGMWWKKFKLYARDNYGITVSDSQAQGSRKFFFAQYPDLPQWHNRQRQFARRNGYVRSLSGRKRRLPKALLFQDTPERREAERQAINSPVQSFANELNLMIAIQLRQEFGRDKVRICGTVHDAILMRVKNEWVTIVAERLLEIMSHPALLDILGIDIRVPLEGEIKIGPWGAGISLERWKRESKPVKS